MALLSWERDDTSRSTREGGECLSTDYPKRLSGLCWRGLGDISAPDIQLMQQGAPVPSNAWDQLIHRHIFHCSSSTLPSVGCEVCALAHAGVPGPGQGRLA